MNEQSPSPEDRIKARVERVAAERAIQQEAQDIALSSLGERAILKQRHQLIQLMNFASEAMVTIYDPEYEAASNVSIDKDLVVASWYLGATSTHSMVHLTRHSSLVAYEIDRGHYGEIDIVDLSPSVMVELNQLITMHLERQKSYHPLDNS